jgi:predicted metal-dependent hydrolase
MVRVHQSPTDVYIPIRNIHFNRDTTRHPRLWHSNDPVPTAFFNALSCTFPDGERFFMDSVRHYRDAVSPELREQI